MGTTQGNRKRKAEQRRKIHKAAEKEGQNKDGKIYKEAEGNRAEQRRKINKVAEKEGQNKEGESTRQQRKEYRTRGGE